MSVQAAIIVLLFSFICPFLNVRKLTPIIVTANPKPPIPNINRADNPSLTYKLISVIVAANNRELTYVMNSLVMNSHVMFWLEADHDSDQEGKRV